MSESINPNLPVTESIEPEGKVVVNGGDTSALWDDLDAVSSKKPEKKAESSEKKQDKSEEKPEKSKDLSSDDKKSAKKEEKPEPKKEKADDSKEESEEAEIKKEIERQVKKLKAKIGDSDLEIDEDALFDVKVSGKSERAALKDLINNYSGKVSWDKKFSELGNERNQFYKARDMANEKLKGIFEEQDPEMKLFKLAELTGKDPVEFYKGWHESSIKMLEDYYSMNEDQRRAKLLEAENKFHKSKADKLESERKQEIERAQFQQKVSQLKAEAKVSDDEFEQSAAALKDIYKNPEEVKALGLPEQFSPEAVIVAIQKDKIYGSAASTAKELGIELAPAKLLEFTDKAMVAGFTAEEIPQMVKEIFGHLSQQSRVQKKVEKREEFTKGKTSVPQQTVKKDEPMFFDDII